MKPVCIIQARIGSSRLPGKVLEFIGRIPALSHVYLRAQRTVEHVVLAIPDTQENDVLERYGIIRDVPVVRGPEDDVLTRYVLAARAHDADVIVRITGDCPFIDPDVITRVVKLVAPGAQYASNVYPDRTFPKGLDVEAFSRDLLERANTKATESYDREHVTPWMQRTQTSSNFVWSTDLSHHRWTLDTPEDLKFFQTVAKHLNMEPPHPTTSELLDLLTAHPEIATINTCG